MAAMVARAVASATQTSSPIASAAVDRSLSPLPRELRHGLVPVITLGFLSFVSSAGLFLFLAFRMFLWSRKAPGQSRNQFIILIFNLLFADIQQSLSFLLNVRWLLDDKINAESSNCWAQAFLISNGDVASGIWCTLIGLHTLASVLYNYRLRPFAFYTTILFTWGFIYGLALIAIALHPQNIYVPAGAWCWIDEKYGDLRLWTHYFWVFFAEFGTVLTYTFLYIGLYTRIRSGYYTATTAVHAKQAARLMALYPAIYVCCTLPLATARMMAMAGWGPSYTRLCVAGSMITSNGFLDVVVYTLTRRVSLFSDEPPKEDNGLDTFVVPKFFGTPRDDRYGVVTVISAHGVDAEAKYNAYMERRNRRRSWFGLRKNRRGTANGSDRAASQHSTHASTDGLFFPGNAVPPHMVKWETQVKVDSEPVELQDRTTTTKLGSGHSYPETIKEERQSYEFETKPKDMDR